MKSVNTLSIFSIIIFSLASMQVVADSIGINVGAFNGIALTYQKPLSAQVAVQFELTSVPYDAELEQDNIKYDMEYDRNNIGVLIQWTPQWAFLKRYFYFAGGIYAGDHNWKLKSQPRGSSWDIGDRTYYSRNLQLSGQAAFSKSSPYLGFGLQRTFQKSITVKTDIGLLYIGKGALSYKASGRIYKSVDDYNSGNNNYLEVSDADFQVDLEKMRSSLEEEIEDYSLLPMFHVGVAYTF